MTQPNTGGSYIERPQDERERRLRGFAQRLVNALGEPARTLNRGVLLDQMSQQGLTTGNPQQDTERAELVESHIRWLLTPGGTK